MILVVPVIPLTRKTKNAWVSAGCTVSPSKRVPLSLLESPHQHCINLGRHNFRECEDLWNPPTLCEILSRPLRTRQVLDELLPNNNPTGPHWHKGPGHKGRGKTFCESSSCTSPYGTDTQQHIEGTEYRVNTVRNICVQIHRKKVAGETDWKWTGVRGSPPGLISVAKAGTNKLAETLGTDRFIIGWDIIVNNNGIWIIEGNSCPGVNKHTAQRIIAQVCQN